MSIHDPNWNMSPIQFLSVELKRAVKAEQLRLRLGKSDKGAKGSRFHQDDGARRTPYGSEPAFGDSDES